MNNRYYLATTGISEIWDINSNLLLLGPWCLTSKENRKLLKNKSYEIISSPFKPATKIKEAADYCHQVYGELLPQLSNCLNVIHQVSYPVRYWQVLICPWLLHFIGVLYDRYKRMEHALEIFPDLSTHVLPMDQCMPATFNMYDFFCKINEDYYNLKLFSLIAYDLCPHNIIETDYIFESKMHTIRYSWKRKLFNRLIKSLDLFSKCSIVLSDMYHLAPLEYFLFKWNMKFKILQFVEFEPMEKAYIGNNCSQKLRKTLRLTGATDRFQSVLYKVLPDAIPMCYLENYKSFKDSINNIDNNINSVRIVGSAVGWYFNERFKFFSAETVSKGGKLIDFQHGGGYGMSLAVPSETISMEKDIFYTWGWSSKEDNKVKLLPSPYLSRLKDSHSTRLNKILFIGVTMPRYHYRFHTSILPEDMLKYFEDKKIFFQSLKEEIRDKILYRPYFYDYGWGEQEIVKKACHNVRFLVKGRAVDWMKKVKLVVIDHPHTSFLEALVINVPSIFYWDHDVYLMRPEAEDYFELLREAGILHRDPESAAKKVNEVYHDPGAWWRQPEIQAARNKFCQKFAMTSENWLEEWVTALKSL